MNTTELFRRAVGEFDRRVQQVKEDQWDLPTPCAEWDVRSLVNHLVNETLWAPELFSGRTVQEVGSRFDGDLLGDDPQGAWARARDGALAAVQTEGALQRVVHVSFGDISGDEYATQLFSDHLIHAWDLAAGIGVDLRLDPELVEVCYGLMKPQEEMLNASGVFGEHVEPPADADPQTRLLAVTGRRAWDWPKGR